MIIFNVGDSMKNTVTLVVASLLIFAMFSGCKSEHDVTEKKPQIVVNPETTAPKDYSNASPEEITYMDYYMSMTAEEQAAFINSFESYDAFFDWHTAAKEDYMSSQKEIDGSETIYLEPDK